MFFLQNFIDNIFTHLLFFPSIKHFYFLLFFSFLFYFSIYSISLVLIKPTLKGKGAVVISSHKLMVNYRKAKDVTLEEKSLLPLSLQFIWSNLHIYIGQNQHGSYSPLLLMYLNINNFNHYYYTISSQRLDQIGVGMQLSHDFKAHLSN